MLCALIMAGGKGTRFWPLSTEEKPKQFLNLVGNETMIQMTVNRIKKCIPIERIFICTGERYIDLVKEQLPEILERNIIIEPFGMNTAPCIALSAFVIKRYYKDAKMVVLPSDHLIKNEKKFVDIVNTASEFLNDYKDAVITLGMTPTRPETGYGYIKYLKEQSININGNSIVKVEEFVEKPNKETAEKYLKDGYYLWNGGMFIWTVDNVINLTKKYLHNTYEALSGVLNIDEDKLQDYINEKYGLTDEISVDYGIMENSNEIYVIPSDFGWDDVGNWSSVERYGQKDEYENVFKADGYAFNSRNNIVLTNKKILLNNIEDLIVVETDDHILISSKAYEQDIKKAKEFI